MGLVLYSLNMCIQNWLLLLYDGSALLKTPVYVLTVVFQLLLVFSLYPSVKIFARI